MNKKREQIGQVEVSFAFRRHQGPKFEQGSVKLPLGSLRPDSCSSTAKWLENENHEKYVRAGVEEALIERPDALDTPQVNFLFIGLDEGESTPHGSQSAACAAPCTVFLV